MENEPREHRIKRLRMRSMRRGIREMDLILDAFAARNLESMDAAGLDRYEALLAESDHDIYAWVSGTAQPPEALAVLVEDIARQLPPEQT